MLKWLRKYNTYILVVGGCLLMVAFLLQGVLSDLSKRGLFGGTAFKIGSTRVSQEEFGKASYEYGALSRFVPVARFGGGEDAKHWYLLTRDATQAGFVGGIQDGKDFLEELALNAAREEVSRSRQPDPGMVELYRSILKSNMDKGMAQALSETRLSQDDIYLALAKLRGASRMQQAYIGTAQYSSRRLATESRALRDMVKADYILVPAERELEGVPEPTKAEIAAHYEKYKDTPRGTGEFGIGYKLPPRIKVEWLEINATAISDALTIDSIEIEKRFLAKYPDGKTPEGKSPDGERTAIASEIRKEITAKAVKYAEQIVRGEIDKPLRKLDRDAEYLKLPSDWTASRPDFLKIRELVAARLLEQYKIMVPAPKVVIRANGWIQQDEINDRTLEGLANAYLRRPQGQKMFSDLAFTVRELGENNEFAFQVGVPFPEVLESGNGNKYFFNILDARKESSPDSLDEVEPQVITNIKRLAAYEKLKAAEPALQALAVSQGLEAVAKPAVGSVAMPPLSIREFTLNKTRTIVERGAEALDNQPFRDAVLSQTVALDPQMDMAKADAAAKTFSKPIDTAMSICIYRVKQLLPLTVEQFRMYQSALIPEVARTELLPANPDESPFSYEAMKIRLNVTDSEGGDQKKDKKTKK